MPSRCRKDSSKAALCETMGKVQRGSNRIAAEKARLVSYGVDIEPLEISCEGIVRQASVFGETLELRRKVTLPIFGLELTIQDTVTNRGFRPTDHAIMYHTNIGYPFLDDTLTIGSLPDEVSSEINSSPPRPGDEYGEKVDVVDNRVTPHQVPVLLRNPKCGIEIAMSYGQAELPNLAIWRAYQSGVFVLGIEPRTDLHPTGGALLQPGQARSYVLTFGLSSV